MKKLINTPILSLFIGLLLAFSSCSTKKYDVLIVTGQSNKSHNWQESHTAVKKIIENADIFSVDVAVSPETGADMSSFHPDFDSYDVVVMDYDGDSWSKETEKDFEKYMMNGGGLVVIHGANNSFPEWAEFNKMTGLGGWKGRNEKSGPYLYLKNDQVIKDNRPGKGGKHGKKGMFIIDTRASEHPIMKGMPARAMHTTDELYGNLRGPAKNIEVLSSAFSNPKTRGTGKHEPVLFTVNYGKGRTFHTVLGHVGKDKDLIAFKSAYFIYTLQRGTEWAASGTVTQKIPEDLPNKSTPLVLPSYKDYTQASLFKNAKKYEVGKSKKFLNLISQRIRNQKGNNEVLAKFENEIITLLNSEETTSDAKNYFCRELSWMGSEKAIPVLKDLGKKQATKDMAQFALTRLTANK